MGKNELVFFGKNAVLCGVRMRRPTGLLRGVHFSCVLCLVFLLSACSMQKSGSKIEARTDKRIRSAESRTSGQDSNPRDKVTLKVDYLTPLSQIQKPEVFVYKEKRRLYVVQSNVLVRDYPIGLGSQPKGDKEKDGDGKTPEGEFFVNLKHTSGKPSKSLSLNYPDRRHIEKAFFSGLIGPSQFREILANLKENGSSPQDTALGKHTLIQSGGAHKDWTDGCVALYDSDMEELFNVCSVGTPVSIRP